MSIKSLVKKHRKFLISLQYLNLGYCIVSIIIMLLCFFSLIWFKETYRITTESVLYISIIFLVFNLLSFFGIVELFSSYGGKEIER